MVRKLLALLFLLSLLSHCRCSGDEVMDTSSLSDDAATDQAAQGSQKTATLTSNDGKAITVAKPNAAPKVVLNKDPQGPIRPEDRGRYMTYTDLKIGGGTVLSTGRQVEFHYEMRLGNGKVVEDSKELFAGKPKSIQLGEGKMLPAIEQGMAGMRVGGKREILVPSYLAFGKNGVGQQIPPNSDITVEVEVVKIYD